MADYKALAKEMREAMKKVFKDSCKSCDMGRWDGHYYECVCSTTTTRIAAVNGRLEDCPFLKFEKLNFEGNDETH